MPSSPPNSVPLLTSSSQPPSRQALFPSFVFCPLLQGCFQSCVMWAPLLCPLYLCLVLHSHLTLILVETQDSSLTPNFLSVRLTWEGDSLLFPALCRALWQHFGSSCYPQSQMMPSGEHPVNSPWSAGTRHCRPSFASCAVCLESSTASSVRPHLIPHLPPPTPAGSPSYFSEAPQTFFGTLP